MESGSWKSEAILGALVVAAISAFVWLTFQVGGHAPVGAQRYVLLMDSALGLSEDNAVAIAGVKVGVVEDITVEGRRARVRIAIEPSVTLKSDARAALRAKTLLGEKYIDIDPGAAPGPALAPDSVLDNNIPTVEIDQVIRDVSLLVDRLNTVAPVLESAAERVGQLLEGEGGMHLQMQVGETLGDVRELVNTTNDLVQGSSEDFASILAMMNARGPVLADRLEAASTRLDTLLGSIDGKVVEEAARNVAPAAAKLGRISDDMTAAMGDVRAAAKRLDSVLARFDRTLQKLDRVDEMDLREFLQLEGVRVHIIPDEKAGQRLQRLRSSKDPAGPEDPRAAEETSSDAGTSPQ